MVNDSNIITINSTESKMKINKFSGNHKQATREGYNLVKLGPYNTSFSGITFESNLDEGWISATGTSTGASAPLVTITLSEGDYVFSGGPASGSASTQRLSIYDNTDGAGTYLDTIYGEKTYQIHIDKETTFRLNYVIPSRVTVNNEKIYPQVVEGTENKPFELYGTMPSIDYPSEVEAVGDNINIFDGETEDGGYNSTDGQEMIASNTIRNSNPINVKGLDTIMFSCDGESIAMNVFEYDADKTFIKMTFNAVDNPFKLSENTAFINFSRSRNIDASKIKIEAGKEVTTYSQYNQGSEKITVLNSNFLEKQEEKTVTWKGLTATVEKDGTIILNGTVTQACYIQIMSELLLGNYNDTSNFKKNFFVPRSLSIYL